MTIDLRSPDLPFRRTSTPGSTVDVELARLHVDRTTKATVSVVRFPPSWRRPGTGHYPCAEELLVLDGAIMVSGVRYSAGEYGYLPPYAPRFASAAPDSCLVLAWFSGGPSWTEDEAPDRVTHAAVHGAPRGRLRFPRADVPGSSSVVDAPPGAVDTPTELVYLDGWHWAFVVPGDPVPARPGPVFIRRWARL